MGAALGACCCTRAGMATPGGGASGSGAAAATAATGGPAGVSLCKGFAPHGARLCGLALRGLPPRFSGVEGRGTCAEVLTSPPLGLASTPAPGPIGRGSRGGEASHGGSRLAGFDCSLGAAGLGAAAGFDAAGLPNVSFAIAGRAAACCACCEATGAGRGTGLAATKFAAGDLATAACLGLGAGDLLKCAAGAFGLGLVDSFPPALCLNPATLPCATAAALASADFGGVFVRRGACCDADTDADLPPRRAPALDGVPPPPPPARKLCTTLPLSLTETTPDDDKAAALLLLLSLPLLLPLPSAPPPPAAPVPARTAFAVIVSDPDSGVGLGLGFGIGADLGICDLAGDRAAAPRGATVIDAAALFASTGAAGTGLDVAAIAAGASDATGAMADGATAEDTAGAETADDCACNDIRDRSSRVVGALARPAASLPPASS